MILLFSSKVIGYGAAIVAFILAVFAFIITFAISDFFIARREKWVNSGFGILMIKLGMAFAAAFWTFITASSLIIKFFGF